MSEYYFFYDVKKSYKIEKWFMSNFHGTVTLEHSAPITFTIDNTTYTIRFVEESQTIYCIKLYGADERPYHKPIIEKIEKFLNKMKKEHDLLYKPKRLFV